MRAETSPRSFATATLAAALALLVGACASSPRPVTKIVNGQVVTTRAVSPQAYEHVTRALLYEQEQRWQKAAEELQRALPFDDEAAEVRAHLAELFLKLERVDDAAEQVAKSIAIAPTVDGWLADAHVREARRDRAGAIEALRRAVALGSGEGESPLGEQAHLELAEAQIAALDLKGAYETAQHLVQVMPASAQGLLHVAALAWALGRVEDAERTLRDAIELGAGDLEPRVLLAELLVAVDRTTAAKAMFREAIDRAEDPFELTEGYAGWLVGRGDVSEAGDLVDRLVAEGGDGDHAERMSRLERVVKRPERAKTLAEKALKGGASPGRVALLLAAAAVEANDTKAALAALDGISKDAPEHMEARMRAAEILRDAGRFDEAARIVDQLMSSPAAAEARVLLIIARSQIDERRGDAAQAARRLDQALVEAPGDARLLLARAAVEERRGDWRRALELAEKVLGEDPKSVEALNFWGFVAAEHGHDLERATKRVQAAIALNPGSGAIIDSLGWAYFRARDLTRAAMFLEQAERLEPGDPEIMMHVGELHLARQDRTRALAAFKRSLTLSPPEPLARQIRDKVQALEAKSAAGR